MDSLVSVCVITYNSEKTILQTLESIKNQTYKNIELIVSDDCSKDNTSKIVKEWLESNSNRFVNSKLLTAIQNNGIAANMNNSIINSTGEWIKVLAGDDLLKESCISEFVNYVTNNPNIEFVVSKIEVFSESETANIANAQAWYDYWNYLHHKSKRSKKRISLYTMIYPGPAWFFKRTLYDRIGGLDLDYSMLDESPFTLKVIQNNVEIYPLDKVLVKYRISDNSAARTNNSSIRKKFLEQEIKFFNEKQLPYLRKKLMIFEIFDRKLWYYLLTKQMKIYDKTGVFNQNITKWMKLSITNVLSKVSFKLFKFRNQK